MGVKAENISTQSANLWHFQGMAYNKRFHLQSTKHQFLHEETFIVIQKMMFFKSLTTAGVFTWINRGSTKSSWDGQKKSWKPCQQKTERNDAMFQLLLFDWQVTIISPGVKWTQQSSWMTYCCFNKKQQEGACTVESASLRMPKWLEKETAAFKAQACDSISREVLIMWVRGLAAPFQTCFQSSLDTHITVCLCRS